jgi:serine protease Do
MKLKPVLGALLAAGVISVGVGQYTQAGTANNPLVRTHAADSAQSAAPMIALPDFSAIAEHVGPAVVNVTVENDAVPDTLARQMPQGPQIDPDGPMSEFFKRFQDPNDPMSEFFKRFRGQQMPPQMPRGQMPHRSALGSGFIISSDGYVLTNAHVVAGAKAATVRLTDKREFKAKVIGVDRPTDVAVLKIDAKDLPTAVLAKADEVKPGQWVAAIGSPFGMENTVTAGIISAKFRALPNQNYVPFIQTDVAVNPGNSGGPLLNAKGEVIGINSQIYSNTGAYAGVSFAIPIDVAVKVKDQLVATGKVERGRIGVTIQGLNAELAKSFGLTKTDGALVSAVEPDSPGAKAGLEPGDVILKLNGEPIAESAQLPGKVAELKPGTPAKLEVWRKGAAKEVTVTLGGSKEAAIAAAADTPAKPQGKLGVAVRPLSPDEQEQSGIKGGLLVEDVGGPAARAGIQAGDVILAFNGTTVKSVEQLAGLVSKSGKNFALLVQRGEAKMFVPVQIG